MGVWVQVYKPELLSLAHGILKWLKNATHMLAQLCHWKALDVHLTPEAFIPESELLEHNLSIFLHTLSLRGKADHEYGNTFYR